MVRFGTFSGSLRDPVWLADLRDSGNLMQSKNRQKVLQTRETLSELTFRVSIGVLHQEWPKPGPISNFLIS